MKERSWLHKLQQQRSFIGLALLIALCLAQTIALLMGEVRFVVLAFYLLGAIGLLACLFPSARELHQSLRQQTVLVLLSVALAMQSWWTLTHLPWMSLLFCAAFLLCSTSRARNIAVTVLGLVFIVAAMNHDWRDVISAMLVPSLLLTAFYYLSIQATEVLLALKSSQLQDVATGCGNERCLQREMTKHAELCERYKLPCTALSINIENWQHVAEQLGSRQSVLWLQELVSVWSSRVRNTDILCRHRDTCFVLLLPNTDAYNAKRLADDLKMASAAYDFRGGLQPVLQCSLYEYQKGSGLDNWIDKLASASQVVAN
ncbi:MAG: GGDEF domain-containing protein [Oleiphilaceae bacterium]|nr:GGDEF domain-containing protein [Oleiphilaceae bacterium]